MIFICFVDFLGFVGLGLVPLGPDRNFMQFPGIGASGALAGTPFRAKKVSQRKDFYFLGFKSDGIIYYHTSS